MEILRTTQQITVQWCWLARRMANPFCLRVRVHTYVEEMMMHQTAVLFTQIIERPARKLILKRSLSADDYVAYATEIGSGTSGASAAWDVLTGIAEALYEPVGLWLPERMRPAGTGMYARSGSSCRLSLERAGRF